MMIILPLFTNCIMCTVDDGELFLLCLVDKVYPTPEEEARRKVLWLACREMVLAHNKLADEGVHTWWMEVNMFADLDKE